MKTYNVGYMHKVQDVFNIFYPETRIQLASRLTEEEAKAWVTRNPECDIKEDPILEEENE